MSSAILERPLDFAIFATEDSVKQTEKLHTETHIVEIEKLEDKNNLPYKFKVKSIKLKDKKESSYTVTLYKKAGIYYGSCECTFMSKMKFTGVATSCCYHLNNVYYQLFHDQPNMETKESETNKDIITFTPENIKKLFEDEKEDKNELAIIPAEDKDALFDIKEMRDEARITKVIEQLAIGELLYAFQTEDKKTKKKTYHIELTYDGIKTFANLMGGIQTQLQQTDTSDPNVIKIYFTATDIVTKNITWGAFAQNKFTKSGNLNKRAFEMAFSKAQRNAIKNLLPAHIIKPLLKKAQKLLEEKGYKIEDKDIALLDYSEVE